MLALVAILGEGTGSMPGNIAYLMGEDAANPDAIWIVELWDSKESHAASLKLPSGFCNGAVKPLTVSSPEPSPSTSVSVAAPSWTVSIWLKLATLAP